MNVLSRVLSIANIAAAIGLLGPLTWVQPSFASSACALPSGVLRVPGDHATIQGAVNAATSGTIILVSAGQYVEQVIIDGKDLSLRGAPGATLVPPSSLLEFDLGTPMSPARTPVLAALNCTTDIDGFAFDGLQRGLDHLRFTGVLYVGAGGTVTNCNFTGFRPSGAGPLPFNMNPERAIQLANVSGQVDFAVRSCSFSDNVGAIFVSGDSIASPNFHAVNCDISDNTVVGLGPQPFQPQTGIYLGAGAGGVVRGNHVSGHQFVGANNFSIGIITGEPGQSPGFVMQNVLVLRNTMVDNNVGLVSLFAASNLIVDNTVHGGMFGFSGIAVSGRRNRLIGNRIDMSQSIVPGNSGALLLGAEFNGALGTGFASDTWILVNRIQGAAIPILSQTGVGGTILHGNVILP
jgi:hypothetical protein